MANVTYEGEQVYIKQINDDEETARIYTLGAYDEEKTVPVKSLIER